MPYLVSMPVEGGGPRVTFGHDKDHQAYMVVGAFGNVNHIDNTGGRPLVITGLPQAPSGRNLGHLVIDQETGQIFIAP